MICIGIDPGVHGGMVAIYPTGIVVATSLEPLSYQGILDWIAHNSKDTSVWACLERVTGYIGKANENGRWSPGAHMFTLGESYGALKMALTVHRIAPLRLLHPTPLQWQRALGIPPRYKQGRKFVESKAQFKRRLKEFANSLRPGGLPLPLTLETCDAFLLARYCQQEVGRSQTAKRG